MEPDEPRTPDEIAVEIEGLEPHERPRYTAAELSQALECEFQNGYAAALADVLRLYTVIHPTEQSGLLLLGETVAQLHPSPDMEHFRREQCRRGI